MTDRLQRIQVTVWLHGQVVEERVLSVKERLWLGDHPLSPVACPTPPILLHQDGGDLLVRGRRLFSGQRTWVRRGPVTLSVERLAVEQRERRRGEGFDLRFLLVFLAVSAGSLWIDAVDQWVDHGQGGVLVEKMVDIRSRLHTAPSSPTAQPPRRTAAVQPNELLAPLDSLAEADPGHWKGRRAQSDDHATGWGWYPWYREQVPVIAEALRAPDQLVHRPDDPELRAHVVQAAYASEQYEDALFQYRWLVVQAPGDVRWLTGMAFTEKRLGMHRLELAAYDRILAIDPDHMQAMGNRAVALARLGRLAEAQGALTALRVRYPQHAMSLLMESMVFAIQGMEVDALGALEEALGLQGSISQAHKVELARELALDPAFARLRGDARCVALVDRLGSDPVQRAKRPG